MKYEILQVKSDYILVQDPKDMVMNYKTSEFIEKHVEVQFEWAKRMRSLYGEHDQADVAGFLGDGKILEFLVAARANRLPNFMLSLAKHYGTTEKIKLLITNGANGWDALCVSKDYSQVFGPVELKTKHITVKESPRGNSRDPSSGSLTYYLDGQWKCHSTQKKAKDHNEARQLIVDKHKGIPMICSMTNTLFHDKIVGDMHLIGNSGALLDVINTKTSQDKSNNTLRIGVTTLYGNNEYARFVKAHHYEEITQI